ncbi:hypothetical protein FCL47_20410 [Desulfopila sp. IMCC35006]|uniref:hypothetical protein n=1 Tax=Desulfopila sp. IMCC35006 TaxID=2569542 RepID=UPI0010AB7272|nr:hypothetical protein [Desulfopila sp. IMCC35006]TKB24027.1 hypothetical protein FCL47_20410 [Desulfopila sp. IMCC35006]
MVQKLSVLFLLSIFSLAILPSRLLAEDFITLNLPEAVITKAAAAVLPLRIDAHSEAIQGDIQIISISELRLTDHHLACRLHLTGTNLALVTDISGHEIKLKVGSVELDFRTDAAIRYDAKKQVLYIKPLVKHVSASTPGSDADIGQELVALLNDREFPVTLQELDPLIAKTGSKTITIHGKIANIQAKPKSIEISLLPIVTAK